MSSIFDFCPIWGCWEIDRNSRPLGKGSFGTVWKAHRRDDVTGDLYYSAIKHISIPQDEKEIRSLIEESVLSDTQSAKKYYSKILESLVSEIKTMYSLRGHTNIVSYEDHLIVPKKDEVGYDLFIRMELLTSLSTKLEQGGFKRADVIKLGMDISRAIAVTDPEYSKRETDYTKALQLLKEEKYDAAIECFIQLGDYLDSQKKLEEARSKAEKEKQYNKAIYMLEQGKYYESAVAFKALDVYKDSAARAEEASAKDRLEKAYKTADGLFASKKYGDAAKAFQALNDYKDSAEKAKLALDKDRQKRHKRAIISLCGVVAFICPCSRMTARL